MSATTCRRERRGLRMPARLRQHGLQVDRGPGSRPGRRGARWARACAPDDRTRQGAHALRATLAGACGAVSDGGGGR